MHSRAIFGHCYSRQLNNYTSMFNYSHGKYRIRINNCKEATIIYKTTKCDISIMSFFKSMWYWPSLHTQNYLFFKINTHWLHAQVIGDYFHLLYIYLYLKVLNKSFQMYTSRKRKRKQLFSFIYTMHILTPQTMSSPNINTRSSYCGPSLVYVENHT